MMYRTLPLLPAVPFQLRQDGALLVLPWLEVSRILGRSYFEPWRPEHEDRDDRAIVARLLELGAPEWVKCPKEGFVNDDGWCLRRPDWWK
jgi:hypothetical protein